VHWGATTQDILNTALALQINECWALFISQLRELIDMMAVMAEDHRHTVMAARTFGGHALPITYGFKIAVWLSSLLRHAERFEALRQRPLEGEFAGVAGTLASLEGNGLAVRKRLMEILALPEPQITWSAMRDRVFERVAVIVGLTSTLAKVMQDVSDLCSTEIGELAEPSAGGKDASSTLPFKANPVYCAMGIARATLAARHLDAVLEGGRQHQERSGEGLLEFQALPQVFIHAGECVTIVLKIFRGLKVFPDRMRVNLRLTYGVVLAERYMMALAPTLGRLAAHDLIHEMCRKAVESRTQLEDVLASTPEVTRHLDRQTITRLADPGGYLGGAQDMIDAVISGARTCGNGTSA
jgi:3-carboxy-cis,cis-muconate cycloisomerase